MDIYKTISGRIIKAFSGYEAFIPNPLPPKFEWDNQLVHALSRADFLLGKLARDGSRLPNPSLLAHSFMTREAVLSSRIEGTQTSISEILVADSGAHVKQDTGDLQEVQNYIKALDYGLERLKELPLSLRFIREVHKHLMQGVRGAHAAPGEFRRVQNWIGTPGCTIDTAKFVPAPPDYLMDILSDLESFLHDKQFPPLIHIALCHYQFEAIHPFLDGNGRVGRLLIMLLLIERKVLPEPLLYLSAFFDATRDEYYRVLYSVSRDGSWRDWFIYFLNGVAVQAEDALSRSTRINALLNQWKIKMASSESSILVNMLDNFASNPYTTINKIVKDLKIAYSTAQRCIQKLEVANIIKKIGDNKRDKVYCAIEIIDILEEPASINVEVS